MTFFLGIDGGGSKTAFLLEDDAGRELARFQTGPSNVLSSGPDNTRSALCDGIGRLPVQPDIVCAGFAGAGRPETQSFYRTCLQTLLPGARILVETDALVAYTGALGLASGVLLIAGTGSIAMGRKTDGAMIRVGGWGPFFGDEGSGHWIGRETVRTALRAHDEGDLPEFIAAVSRALGIESITAAPAAWNSGALPTAAIATLATLIFERYPDEPANRILTEAAAHLRAITLAAARRVGAPGCPKSAAGAIARNPLMQRLMGLDFTPPLHSPERGAILWAKERLGLSPKGGPGAAG